MLTACHVLDVQIQEKWVIFSPSGEPRGGHRWTSEWKVTISEVQAKPGLQGRPLGGTQPCLAAVGDGSLEDVTGEQPGQAGEQTGQGGCAPRLSQDPRPTSAARVQLPPIQIPPVVTLKFADHDREQLVELLALVTFWHKDKLLSSPKPLGRQSQEKWQGQLSG